MVKIDDEWAAFQFDNAVVNLGNGIEGLIHERENIGDEKHPQWRSKYNLAQLLDPDFRIRPVDEERERQVKAIETLKAWSALSGGKVKYIKA